MDLLIINGPNLNLLGKREPSVYGSQSFDDFFSSLKLKYPSLNLSYFQSNHEGEIIDKLHEKGFDCQGITWILIEVGFVYLLALVKIFSFGIYLHHFGGRK